MLIKTKAFVLSSLKYNDADIILKCYTEQTGFTSFYLKGILKSKKGKLKKAFFQPNSILELIASHRNKQQLEFVREASPAYHYKNLNLDFNKLTVSTFIREVLLESLKHEDANPELYQFIEQSFILLDTKDFSADFHLFFLLELSKFLGFHPGQPKQGNHFDLEEGVFSNQIITNNFLNKQETELFRQYLGMIFDDKNREKFSNIARRKLLDIMLRYYQAHIDGFSYPKSIKVLHQIY